MTRKPVAALAMGLALLVTAGVELGPDGPPAVSKLAPLPRPPRQLAGHRMRPRPNAVRVGTAVPGAQLFTDRVLADASTGFALANDGFAQYPVRTTDGGRDWRIDGPQFHVPAADGAEGIGYAGLAGPRTYFGYGSSVVDVTTNAGRSW